MSRTISGAERDILRLAHYEIHARMTVQNIPFEDLLGVNPIKSFSVVWDLNEYVGTASIVCKLLSGAQSLSPYLSTGAQFDGVPFLTSGFYYDLEVQCVAPGQALSPGGWRKIFPGLVDDIDIDPAAGLVTIKLKDKLDRLIRTEIENLTDVDGQMQWGFPVGTLGETQAVEDAMQFVLDTAWDYAHGGNFPDNFVILAGPSGTTVSGYWEPPSGPRVHIFEALRRLGVGKNGWDLRGRWDQNGLDTFDLTYYLPFGPEATGGHFFSVSRAGGIPYTLKRLGWSRRGIKNIAEITPADALRVPVVVENAESVARYNRAFLAVRQDAASHIDNSSEANILGQIITNSLGRPPSVVEVETPFIWFVELNDLFGLESDGQIFDHGPGGPVFDLAATTFGVSRLQLDWNQGAGKTLISGRQSGAIAAAAQWRKWSGKLIPMRDYVSEGLPVGPSEERQLWIQVPPA